MKSSAHRFAWSLIQSTPFQTHPGVSQAERKKPESTEEESRGQREAAYNCYQDAEKFRLHTWSRPRGIGSLTVCTWKIGVFRTVVKKEMLRKSPVHRCTENSTFAAIQEMKLGACWQLLVVEGRRGGGGEEEGGEEEAWKLKDSIY